MGVKLNNIYEKTYETTLVSVDPRNIEDPNFSKDQLAQSEDARVISGQVSTFEEPSVPFAFERVYDAFRHDPEVSKADAAHQAQIERIAETGAQERKRLHGNEAAFAASASCNSGALSERSANSVDSAGRSFQRTANVRKICATTFRTRNPPLASPSRRSGAGMLRRQAAEKFHHLEKATGFSIFQLKS